MISLPRKLCGRTRLRKVTAYGAVVISCCLWFQLSHVNAQSNLAVTTNFNTDMPQNPHTPIELRLSRDLKATEGHVAIIIDHADVTSLFIPDGARLVYSAALVPLPLRILP